jgi:glycosyltransferase involved in cell wall biosynthesis
MKVLYITPVGVATTSPQIEMANYLRKRFARLDLWVQGVNNPSQFSNDWDVIFGAMEASVPAAYQLSKILKLPVYCHWEYLPPYRLYGYQGGADPRNWGYRQEHLNTHYKNQSYYNNYKNIIESAIASNINSCAGKTFKEQAQVFSGNNLNNCFIKYPAAPVPLNKDRNTEKRNYFTTVSRLVPNKRVADLAMAVKKANLETTWLIIGDGPEKQIIKTILKDCRTKVEFLSKTDGEEKFILLSEAKFQLSAWHGLPQLEAALVGTPTINLEIPYIRELYGDLLTWAKDTEDLAEKMKVFNSQPKLCKEQAEILYEAASTNKLNINTLSQGADIIEDALRKIAKEGLIK